MFSGASPLFAFSEEILKKYIYFERVNEVEFFLGSEDGEIVFDLADGALFTHRRDNTIVLPD